MSKQLILQSRRISTSVTNEIYTIGKYTVCVDVFAGGGRYITVSRECEKYLPHITCNMDSYMNLKGFHVETTSYGGLLPEEIAKVINGLQEAKEVAEILTREFMKNKTE